MKFICNCHSQPIMWSCGIPFISLLLQTCVACLVMLLSGLNRLMRRSRCSISLFMIVLYASPSPSFSISSSQSTRSWISCNTKASNYVHTSVAIEFIGFLSFAYVHRQDLFVPPFPHVLYSPSLLEPKTDVSNHSFSPVAESSFPRSTRMLLVWIWN